MNSTSTKTCKYCSTAITPSMIYGRTIICGGCGMTESQPLPKESKSKKVLGYVVMILISIAGVSLKKKLRMMIDPEGALRRMSTEQVLERYEECMVKKDQECVIMTLKRLAALEPQTVSFEANLAMQLTLAKRFQEADPIYKKIISAGTGTYDLTAFYALNFESLGQNTEAIKWYEKSLSIEPELRDVTQRLARAYVKDQRPMEAVSLLRSYIQRHPELEGQFAGDLSVDLELVKNQTHDPKSSLRLVGLADGHFYLPLTLNENQTSEIFMLDTGASIVSMPTKDIQTHYPELIAHAESVNAELADGKVVEVKRVIVPRLQIGSWAFDNVEVAFCDTCSRLAGMSLLKNLKMEVKSKGAFYSASLAPL